MTFGPGARYGFSLAETTELAIDATNLLDKEYVAFRGVYAEFCDPGGEIQATLRHRW